MISKIALFIASLAAALMLAVALAASGFAPASRPAAAAPAVPVAATSAPQPVSTVYLAAQPTPATITVTQTAPPFHGDDGGGHD